MQVQSILTKQPKPSAVDSFTNLCHKHFTGIVLSLWLAAACLPSMPWTRSDESTLITDCVESYECASFRNC